MIERLHHVTFTVPTDQVPEARAFYCGLLGLKEIPKPESVRANGGFWLELAGQEIHVSIQDGVVRHGSKTHIAFQVSNLDAWKSKLEAAGVVGVVSLLIPGYVLLELRDPFGNRFELLEPVA